MPGSKNVGRSPDIGVVKKKKGGVLVKQKTAQAADPYANVEVQRGRPTRRLITIVRSPQGP
jgi:hypothetical protein